MIIHVVKPGESITSIADFYGVSVARLIMENDIPDVDNLVVGQALVILKPEISYIVQRGDTLFDVAEKNGVSVIEILRNNPFIADRDFLYEGELLVIKYETDKVFMISTAGYAFPYIDLRVLRKTLPFLTYLTIFNYTVNAEGDLIGVDDSNVLQLAKTYGVAPMLFLSALSEEGINRNEVVNSLLNNLEVQERTLENTLALLKSSGYYGLNVYIRNFNNSNSDKIVDFLSRASKLFHSEGFRVVVTISPVFNTETKNIIFEEYDYEQLTPYVDGIVLATYEWGFSYGCPSSIAPVNVLYELLNFTQNYIPPDKTILGLIPFGYSWPIPYVPGYTNANSITMNNAVQIASEEDVPIQFNNIALAPYYFYYRNNQLFLTWFKDARTFAAVSDLVSAYKIQGLSIWTIMSFNAQLWLIINNTFCINKIYEINICEPEE